MLILETVRNNFCTSILYKIKIFRKFDKFSLVAFVIAIGSNKHNKHTGRNCFQTKFFGLEMSALILYDHYTLCIKHSVGEKVKRFSL